MAIKLKSNSAYDGQVQETNTAARQYYLPNNDSGLGTQLMTAQATTSGSTFDFTIPSWAKRITVVFNEVSLSGASDILVQLGSGSVTATGYVSTGIGVSNANTSAGGGYTTGFGVYVSNAAYVVSGAMIIHHMGSNLWIASHSGKRSTTQCVFGGGSVTLAGAIDRVRVAQDGANTFDNGSVTVIYE